MPTYTVTDSQTGLKLRLTGDSPPTEGELADIFAQHSAPAQAQPPSPDQLPSPSRQFLEAAGHRAADAFYAPTQSIVHGIQSLVGQPDNQPGPSSDTQLRPDLNAGVSMLDRKIARREADINAMPDNAATVAGGIVGRLAPLAVTGSLNAAYNAPGQALKAIGFPFAKYLGGILGGAGIGGAGAALLTPATDPNRSFAEQKLNQAETGAAVGGFLSGVLPPITAGAKFIGSQIDPLLPGGTGRTTTKYQREIIGKDNVDAVVKALQGADEIVPGSVPTAGEAVAGVPEGSPIIAHQKIIAAQQGGPSAQFGQRIADQQAARQAVIGDIARTPEELVAALQNRSTVSGDLYRAANEVPIQADKTLNGILANPYVRTAVKTADDLAEANGVEKGSTSYLHYVKIGLDKLLRMTGDSALDKTEKAAVTDVQGRLVNWLAENNPAYELARSTHQELSVPINRMRVGQELADKLTAPTGTENPGSYLRSLGDAAKVVKDATGMRNRQLADILSPDQVQSITSVANDLERNLAAKRPLQPTNLSNPGHGGESAEVLSVPSFLNRKVMVAKVLLRILGHKLGDEMTAEAANRYLSPQKLADALSTQYPRGAGFAVPPSVSRLIPAMEAARQGNEQ